MSGWQYSSGSIKAIALITKDPSSQTKRGAAESGNKPDAEGGQAAKNEAKINFECLPE